MEKFEFKAAANLKLQFFYTFCSTNFCSIIIIIGCLKFVSLFRKLIPQSLNKISTIFYKKITQTEIDEEAQIFDVRIT